MKFGHCCLALALSMPCWPAYAADNGDMDVTMSVIDKQDAVDEREFVKDIQLPEPPPPDAGAAAPAIEDNDIGRDQANEARQQGQQDEHGRSEDVTGGGQGNPSNSPGGG